MISLSIARCLGVVFVFFCVSQVWGASQFPRDFAPSDDWVKPQEAPCRAAICLNGSWQFQPMQIPGSFKRDTGEPPALPLPAADNWDTTPIKIPSPWNVNDWGNGRHVGEGTAHPYWPDSVYYPGYPESWAHFEMGWLRRTFRVPAEWNDKRLVLHFEAVAGDCQVWINGTVAGEHFDSFLPFEIDVTSLARRDDDNELLVGVRHHRLFNKTSHKYAKFKAPYPPGSELERIVGIWQDVHLLGLPKVRVQDAFVQPLLDQDTLRVEVTVRNDSDQPQELTVGGSIYPWVNLAGSDVLDAPEPKWKLADATMEVARARVAIRPADVATIVLGAKVNGRLKTWSPASPNLYALVLNVSEGASPIDRHFTRFGWRQLKISGKDLLLNGSKLQMFGDLSHPFGPFMMSRRFVWSWYKMIKDFGGNAVRPHAQPYPRCYLDLADEMGIMVLDETAMFGSSIQLNFEDPAAWPRFAEHYDSLVMRDRNHPCVFGWSCGNELFAIFNLNQITKEDSDLYYSKLIEYAPRATRLDPTREWISCDGDEDLHGTLPVWSKHFGLGLRLKDLPDEPKPRMVGESGGTYYATPRQLSEFNGDRAYESYAGRNEALAIDLYQNVVKMARPLLTYFSPSEMVWFGLEHLPLGFDDFARLPTVKDGVFFKSFQEGKPGMQLERIPPYVTTLNPGLDPHQPLYKPLAMFDAMKAALATEGPRPCPWDHVRPAETASSQPPAPKFEKVAFAGDRSGALCQKLTDWGVPLADDNSAPDAKMLIVDGQIDSAAIAAIRERSDRVRSRGGLVLVMLRQRPSDAGLVNQLLPAAVQVTDRQATMLVQKTQDARLSGLRAEELYFAQIEGDRGIVKCGLAGPIVDRGTVLLEAGNTDWSQFVRVPEVAKCGATVMYEQHRKPGGAALVEFGDGPGKTFVSTIDYEPDSEKHTQLWRDLLARIGIRLKAPTARWVLPIATVSEEGTKWRYTLDAPAPTWSRPGFDDSSWKTGRAGFGTDVPGSKVRTPWRTADIWLRDDCDFSETNFAELKMLVHHDEDVEVYVNGVLIYTKPGFVAAYQKVEMTPEMRKSFQPGNNVIAVHCHQTTGGQYIDVGFAEGVVPDSVTADRKAHDLLLDGPAKK